jgi:hypothetical protein
VQIAPPTRLPSDAQRATYQRAGGGRGANPIKLGPPGKVYGIVALIERRRPKRVVALLDVEGRRIRWDREAGEWQLHPWRFDP